MFYSVFTGANPGFAAMKTNGQRDYDSRSRQRSESESKTVWMFGLLALTQYVTV